MRYAILAEPSTLALLGLGLFILTFLAVVALACIFALRVKRLGGTVFDFISGKMRKIENPVAPVAPATEVMPRKCPQCGGALPPDAPEGLCPACLLQHGFATEGGVPPGQPSFVPPPISELAKLFPQLEILECLGRGGMGAVYKARQPRLDRLVALKILAPEKQNDLQFAERFEREARALARLNHPNIVTVFDFGEVSGQFYLLMEFVDGLTLRQLLQNGKLAPAEALNIVPKICEALQYAHEQGIVHRDIKPENILLDKQGRVKIADFGIAKIAGLEPKGFSLTGARDVMGTPHYMAPEQVEKPQTVDHRADIFSLGVVFYEMLTGELPLGKFAPPSQKVHVDVRLDEVVLHALEKEPARRYQHASQVKTAVETIAGTPAEFAAAGANAPVPFPAAAASNVSDKTILPAFLLAFFFGVFGAHRFYVGKFFTACLQLLALCSCIFWIVICALPGPQPLCGLLLAGSICGCLVWATIDWLLLVCKAFKDGQGKRMTNWIQPDADAAKPAAQTFAASAGGNAIPPLAMVRTSGDRSGMITAPAVLLMVAALWKLFSALTAVFVLTGIGGWLGSFAGIGNIIGPWGSVAIFSVVLFKLVPGLLILFGGYLMLQRQSYGWAIAAGIISIISCSLIGFPAGIWALIVLARDDVKTAFGANVSAAPLAPQTVRSGRSFAVIAGSIVLILVVLACIAGLTFAFVPTVRNHMKWGRPYLFGGQPFSEVNLTPQQLKLAGIYQDGAVYRKDSTQSFPLNADGRFSIDNVDGSIEIHGGSSNAVVMHAAIHGRTGEAVNALKINVHSDPGQVEIHTDLGDHLDSNWNWLRRIGRGKASVDYIVQVPQHARLSGVHSVDGRITIDGETGPITATTVDGAIEIKNAADNLKLSAVDGSISVSMDSLGAGQSVSLHTVDGGITLALPEDAAANFSVHTVDGGVASEFPELQPKEESVVGHKLKGKLGKGGAEVTAETVDGAVNFVKNRVPRQTVTNPTGSATNLPPSGVSQIAADVQGAATAVPAAQAWLALNDAGNYSASWNQASAIFQGAVTEAAWEKSMNTFRQPLGALVSRQLKSALPMTELPGAPDGQYVVLQFETAFANKKSAVETVTFVWAKDGQWKSAGYFIK
jgi:tRNA A-37 threonylcarbamoyl transferase component Bud32